MGLSPVIYSILPCRNQQALFEGFHQGIHTRIVQVFQNKISREAFLTCIQRV